MAWIIETRINDRPYKFAGKDGQWTDLPTQAATFKRRRDALSFVYQNPEIWDDVRMRGGAISGGKRDYYAIDGKAACGANRGALIDWQYVRSQAAGLEAVPEVLADIDRRIARSAKR